MATEPKYQLVASTLRREIADGIFAEGSLLTTEEELKRRFQVSRQPCWRTTGWWYAAGAAALM